VSTLVAVELGVANGSNAGDGGRSDEPHQVALSASSGHSVAKTLPSGTTGVKVEQPQLAVAGVAMEPP